MNFDLVFVFDKTSPAGCSIAESLFKALKRWVGLNVQEPPVGDRAPFNIGSMNICVIMTENCLVSESVQEAVNAAIAGKKLFTIVHDMSIRLDVEEEIKKATPEIQKALAGAPVIPSVEDLRNQCNDLLMSKIELKKGTMDLLGPSRAAREERMREDILNFSAKVAKARNFSTMRRRYDFCITAADPDLFEGGVAVVSEIFNALSELAPALSLIRNRGDKAASNAGVRQSNVRESFNLIMVVTKNALTPQSKELLDEVRAALENEVNVLMVHHVVNTPSILAELEACEDEVLKSSLCRVTRFTYLEGFTEATCRNVLDPSSVKIDDTKTPRTRATGVPSFKLNFKNNKAMELAEDGRLEVYRLALDDKTKKLPSDVDDCIKALFETFDPEKKGRLAWEDFGQIDRVVTETLGGQYSEMISRRVYSMMLYPGLTLDAEISYTTFRNYHAFLAQEMGIFEGDKDVNIHYKYVVDKVKHMKKGKRFNKMVDLFISHDRSKASNSFSVALRASVRQYVPNVRTVVCTDKSIDPIEIAKKSLNILVLLRADTLQKDEVKAEITAGTAEGAVVIVMTHLEHSVIMEQEIDKAPPEIRNVMARPAVVEYWQECESACMVKMLDLLNFPDWRPLANRNATFRNRDNPVVLFLYQKCEEDQEAAHCFQAIANLSSPCCLNSHIVRQDFLRDGGMEILAERMLQYTAVPAVAENACRVVANLGVDPQCAHRLGEVGIVKTLVDILQSHSDAALLQGEACRAIANLSQDEFTKLKLMEHGAFHQLLQSQKKFEYAQEFWDGRFARKRLSVGEALMANYKGQGRWCSGKVLESYPNGTYDVSYSHGGVERKVPALLVRPKDKEDSVREFCGVWEWRPTGKLTEDELILKSDGMCSLRGGQVGTWTVANRGDDARTAIKLQVGTVMIEMERISISTLRSTTTAHRSVLKLTYNDCLYVEYFSFPSDALHEKIPPLWGRTPDVVRVEQHISRPKRNSPSPWSGLDTRFHEHFATVWKGKIEITRMGEYEFFLDADSGARLFINDKLVVESPNSRQINLNGGQHNIKVDFFAKNAATKAIELRYSGPDTGDETKLLPVAVLQYNPVECRLVQRPGFIAEYFPGDYSTAGAIPEGLLADVLRVEKHIDFILQHEPWQNLPSRYGSNPFASRYTGYLTVTCGGKKKAKYTFFLESTKNGKLYVNDALAIANDEPVELELSPGPQLLRIEYFAKEAEARGLRLKFQGPETKPEKKAGEEAEPAPVPIIAPPTMCSYATPPIVAVPKGEPSQKHTSGVTSCVWSKTDKYLASGSLDATVCLWDPVTGVADPTKLECAAGVLCMQFANAGTILACGLQDNSIQMWDVSRQQETRAAFTGHTEPVLSVVFSSDDSKLMSCSGDGTVRFWDVNTGEEITSEPGQHVVRSQDKKKEIVQQVSLTLSCDGKMLVSGGRDGCLYFWNPAKADPFRGPDKTLPLPPEPEEGWGEEGPPQPETEPGDPIFLKAHALAICCVAFSPKDPNRLATVSEDATIRLWNMETKKEILEPIQCLSSFVEWSPDAATLVSCNNDTSVQLWSAVSGKARADPQQAHASTVTNSCWAPIGQCFAAVSEDQTLRLWHFMVNRNIAEIAELEGEQTEFNTDMRGWQKTLDKIRRECTDYKKGLSDYKPDVTFLREALDKGVERTQSYNLREELLGLTKTDYFDLDGVIDDFEPYYRLWNSVIEFQHLQGLWHTEPLATINATEVENKIDTWFKDSNKMIKLFDNDNMRVVQTVAKHLRDGIEDFRLRFPFLRAFSSDAILPRHWDELFKRLDAPSAGPPEKITLDMMLALNILDFSEDFEEISAGATKEYMLKKALAAMQHDWKPLEFSTGLYKETGVALMRGIDDIQTYLDDHIVKTQAIRSSPFCKPFEKDVLKWESTLLYIQDLIDQTIALQRSWMALEPIFLSEDIKRQLPHESESFAKIDATFRKRMKEIDDTRKCLAVSEITNIVEDMKLSNETIEKVQKGLKDYLETKRLFFPRFFFLNDADLLSILAETKDPTLVQPHMGKAFEGIMSVRFDDTNTIIEAMISGEGESVDLVDKIDVMKPGNKGAVERWLLEVEESMMDTLRDVIKKSNEKYAVTDRTQWCQEEPGQVVLCTDCIYWTQFTTEHLNSKKIGTYEKQMLQELSAIIKLVRGEMPKLARVTVGAMVTLDVHMRDVVTELRENKVEASDSFQWLQHLRYYWKEAETFNRKDTGKLNPKMECWVSIVNSTLLYGFEYLGNTARLVVTPLTDRCYRTLMGAFALYYGGAPEGPAGTGKTESTKDLAKALAIQCVVFNCSDSMDYRQLATFFKGLASSGSWCCFDEFNRISLEVLSVVAQQIQQISLAIKQHVNTFIFEDTEIRLVATCAVNITMNPGYAGRSELPDNLKALFRPCAMMVPNYALIAEIRLYSFGYEDAKRIGTKACQALKLSSEQLSPAKHYDFGMRGLNALLVAGGNGKRTYGEKYAEDVIALRSFTDVNLPKFVSADIPLFKGIISDLFPGVRLPPSDFGPLIAKIEEVAQEMGLQPTRAFSNKVVQLWETIMVRHGLMTVGMPPCGKTMIKDVLARTLAEVADGGDMFLPVTQYVMNPKSITQGQLYGESDLNTGEWTNGVLANAVRDAAKAVGNNYRQWVVLDGPVDAIWIENMNTVLDDNKKLCLNSGEIIKLSPVTTMLFEVRDLEYASPATVSRVGIVFLEPDSDLGWLPIFTSWLDTLPQYIQKHHKKQLNALFTGNFEILLECTRRVKTPVAVSDNWMTLMATRLLESFICDRVDKFCKPSVEDGNEDEEVAQLESDRELIISQLFWFAMTWSVAACTDPDGRALIDSAIKALIEGKKDAVKKMQFVAGFETYELASGLQLPPPPRKQLLHDFFIDPQDGAKWKPWVDRIDNVDIPREAQYHTIVVPTTDTVRNQFLIRTLIEQGYNVLISGPTGTAKTASINGMLLSGFNPELYSTNSFAFSAQTTANQTQDIIDGKLDKRRKGVFGPPINKKMLVFIDDLNMPTKEEYGAQPPIEILRQVFIKSPSGFGWYDRKGWDFRQLVDMHFLAAMGPPGAGKNDVTDRYTRMFNLVFVTPFDEDSLARIFSTVVGKFMSSMARDVAAMTPTVVAAVLEVYSNVCQNFLPTPEKSHYTFNMRDVSKVFQGVCQCSRESLPKVDDVVRVWWHECERVFRDRLVNRADNNAFVMMQKRLMDKHFKRPYDQIIKQEPVIFGDFADAKSTAYMEITDQEKMASKMQEALDEFNQTSKIRMDLVLFTAFLQHICRCIRVLKLPLGHSLLVGVGGSGRKSTTTLAAFIADYRLFQIEISKSYGLNEWHEDLKQLLIKAGADGLNMVFLFPDTQMSNETFLEEVSSVLNTGEAPNIYTNEDKMDINERCTKGAAAAGKSGGSEVFSWYIEQCRKNLSIVLAMSPIGSTFRNRLRSFPSLVNCCAIDWFQEWPPEALNAVANQFLRSVEMTDEIKTAVVQVMVEAQVSVSDVSERFLSELKRHYYVTPTSYLELINSFASMLNQQRQIVQQAKWRYDVGLEKIADAASQVAALQKDLEDLQPVLEKATKDTGEMMVRVEGEQKKANEKQVIVDEEASKAGEVAKEAIAIKEDCEKDLAAAIPALEAAVDALSKLSKGDIGEVKAMKTPPAGVILTCQAMCYMFNVKPAKVAAPDGKGKVDDYWEPSKKELLGDPRLLDKMINYDKDNITEDCMKKVMPLYNDPGFEPDVIKKASVAAMGICKWVRAMVVYDKVAKEVGPKRASLAAAEKKHADAVTLLESKQAELAQVIALVDQLVADLEGAKKKMSELQQQRDDCAGKLVRAEKLITGLGGEKASWMARSKTLGQNYINLTGDILMAGGVCAYLGVFTSAYRNQAMERWLAKMQKLEIPASKEFSLPACIGDQVKIRQWVIDKLPNDALSVDNAIILDNSRRWPLMIDPQMQANKWIKNMCAGKQLKCIRLNQASYVRELEVAIQFGNPVLLENIGTVLDPVLDPLLQKATFKQGTMEMIRLGDNTIEYSKDFKLYLTTKLPNPHYAPELCVSLCILNFMATIDGLQDGMLSIAVAKEEPAIEETRQNLVIEGARAKAQLKEIEDKILALLSASTGNILDDEELIDTLSNSKVMSVKIEEQVKQQEITGQQVQETRATYRPFALRCAALFFIVSDLCIIDPMYQFSLDWFMQQFIDSIDRAAPADNKEDRFKSLFDSFLNILYNMVCRSLFEKDKLLYSFMLSIKCQETDGELNMQLLMALLTCLPGTITEDKPTDGFDWVTDVTWQRVLTLNTLGGVFEGFKEEFTTNIAGWQAVFDNDKPLEVEWPRDFRQKCDPLQRALTMFAMRPDAVVQALQDVVAAKLGKYFLEVPPFDLPKCFSDARVDVPLVFILSTGSDPMADIAKLAESMGMLAKIVPISLGQGQGPKAIAGITDASKTGKWVLLQNCHLGLSFMPVLESMIEKFDVEALNADFRLWLTACPTPDFPISILQNSIKMTIEPPKGIKNSLTRAYASIDEEWFESCTKPTEFKKLLFGLFFFHAVILERRSFGPVGWNISYGFSEPDRDISRQQLCNFLDEFPGVPWEALNYMVAEANYGGRVTDGQDRRAICAFLLDYYTPDILKEDYKFSISGIYYSPEIGPISSYLEYIKTLPINHTPEVFWLHSNANLTAAINEGTGILKMAVQLISSFGAASTGEDVVEKKPEEIFSEIASDTLAKLPEKVDLEAVQRKFPVKYDQCLNTVLAMELGKFNRLLAKLRDTLSNLGKAVKGLVVFSPELEAVGEACLTNTIPAPWMGVSYPSLKPMTSYITDFIARWKFLANDWVKLGAPNVFWFSCFFFQQAFLTGVLQNCARKEKHAIDCLTWDFDTLKVANSNPDAPENGAYIKGLFMEGARWDDENDVVADSFPKVLWCVMPYIWLQPVLIEASTLDVNKMYACPVYKTSDRRGVISTSGHSSNFIVYMYLRHAPEHSERFWTKRGVAMISQTDD